MKKKLLVCALCTTIGAAAQQLPFQNPKLTTEQRIDDLLQRLTLEEKASLMQNASPAIERLGIPQFEWWNEALHGVGRNGYATVYPITMALASTWNDQLVEQIFTAVSDEARAKNTQARREGTLKQYAGLSFWTPNINIFRDPRWGRGQETYGEDPFLTSRMGVAVVRGLQGPSDAKYRKLLACAKHFAVHSGPEWNRHKFNIEDLPERDLWETYLPAFKALVDAGVAEVMCAYQRIDGEPCCAQNRYERQILRQDWGFRGLITSDCGAIWDFLPDYHNVSPDAVNASAKAVSAGTDLECGNAYSRLPKAVSQGEISEQDIDRSLRRLLRARFELGDMDSDELVEWTRIPADVVASEPHKLLALQAAREGIVLLKNDGTLPLAPTADIAVMGPNANDSVMMWGNYAGTPTQTITILQGIRQRFGQDIAYEPGCSLVGEVTEEFTMPRAGTIIFVGGISPSVEGEQMDVEIKGFKGGDRTSIELPAVQRHLLRKLHEAGKRVILVNCSGSAIALGPEDASTCNAIVQAWYGGEAGGQALAEVLSGDVNPSGKLPVTFYKDDAQLPDYLDYRMTGRTYRYLKEQPLYPFGHGLSYTTFRVSKQRARVSDGKLIVSCTVENTGQREGTETVQVYLRRTADAEGPQRSLRGFKRVSLKPGEKQVVALQLTRDELETWDAQTNTMRVVPGQHEVMVGTTSAASQLKTLKVKL